MPHMIRSIVKSIPGARSVNRLVWRLRTGFSGRNLDGVSQSVDPLLVGPVSGTPAPIAFRLQAASALRNAGCLGGGPVPCANQMHMGAYLTDDPAEVIGPGVAIDAVAPNSPVSPRIVP